MKTTKLIFCLSAAMFLLPRFASADLVGNYTADANTLVLLHFDEAAGGSVAANAGSLGGNFYTVANSTSGDGLATPPTVTTMLGWPGYVNGATNFNNCLSNGVAGYLAGYDYNNSGAYQGDVNGSTLSPDRLNMSVLNIGNGGNTPFTLEVLVKPTTITAANNQEIICTDSSAGSRGFQFRITTAGVLQFSFINGSQAVSGTIPTTGADAFVAGTWYHVAVTYNGTTATLYWTKLDPSNGAAHILTTAALNLPAADGSIQGPLVVGNENRNSSAEHFQGCIDEVRISNVARGSGQMQFYSPAVTITLNPVSQNVDYNQPVRFDVAASSQFPMGYQWRFNSNSIPNATNTFCIITNVAADNAGYYDCVVTNTIGRSATSTEAHLVVGAANFIANRYSFTNDTSDSIGGQWGTNFGNATVSGGKLVLDGTSGTYMQLPGNLFNGANATALTVEFWATYGSNPNNVYPFAFGYTNYILGSGIVGVNYAMYSAHTGGGGQTVSASSADPGFGQSATASGNFDGQTVHVACVFDPPNKQLSIYTNGVLEVINTNFTINISSLNDQLSYIGRSLWDADPYLNASIDEIRIFKGALSGISIKQSQDQGPDTLLADGPAKFVLEPVSTSVPVGWPATFTVATVGYLPITYQWFKNGTPVPSETNATLSFTADMADNGATFFCRATNTIGVTTYVTNSTTATLNVFTPPTLSWLGATDGGIDNYWNTGSPDWTNDALGGGVIMFAQTNAVYFDDRSGGGVVDLAQTIIPYAITVNASSGYTLYSYSAMGSLAGPAPLIKQNTGLLVIEVTNNLSGPVTVSGGTLQIGNGDSFGSLGSGPVTNNATISINRGDTALNVANSIHGSGTLSIDGGGGGAVTISGNNDYSGGTLINSGIVYLTSGTGLGDTSGGTTVANGAQLYITANADITEPLQLNGAGSGGALHKGGGGLTVYNGPINLGSDSTIDLDGGATLVLSNVVSGTAALTAAGSASGTLTLNANNTFSGGFTLNGPIVDVNASQALGSGPVTVSGGGRFVIGDGLTITNAIVASVVTPGALTGLLMVNDNTNGTVTTVSGPLEFDATPSNGGDFVGPTSSGYLNVTGPITNMITGAVSSRIGFVRFSGGGNYTVFTIGESTVSIGANNGICPAASLTMGASGAATFDLNGFNQTLTGLTDGASNPEVITNSAATAGTLTLDLASGSTFSGSIGGKVALVENGSGNNLYLAGTNSYTGNTTVNSGTLELAQPGLAASSTVTVAGGAVLQLDFTVTNQVFALVINGVSAGAGVYSSANAWPYLAGSGYLLVNPGPSGPAHLTNSVNGTTLSFSWPAGQGWRLVSQTNRLSVGLTTNGWSTVPGGIDGSNSITIDRSQPTVFYRLVYP